ncbi:MAG: acyl-CoA synthetase [Candidatus Accumulibacter sp.]|nr:acyl-CoA synthetase [Accumulibacter sp.]
MKHAPLLGHASLDEVFAYTPAGPVDVRSFLTDVGELAACLPAGNHFLNLCQDRYRFTVGLAAGLLTGRVSLQPSSQSVETLRQIQRDYADVFCLCDCEFATANLPRFDFPQRSVGARSGRGEPPTAIPSIPAGQLAILVFTSGSTGRPLPHGKSWGSLVINGRAEASRLGLFDGPRHAIVGTVPPQHMYGFESTVLLAMHGNAPFWSGKPFYPLDIVAALNRLPRPRLLVSTPFHLRTLLAAGIELPAIDRVLSATAPLPRELAAEAERQLAAPLYEIYGCTESGQLASRQPTVDPVWLPFDGVHLTADGDRVLASGGHVPGQVALSDEVSILPDGRFLLGDRHTDQIGIAGKRSSLAYLNQRLLAIPGVVDGTFFQPTASDEAIVRLCAFVVAPGIDERQLLAALREQIDAVFLPRPLFKVDALPRSASSKLPRESLQALYDTLRNRRDGNG